MIPMSSRWKFMNEWDLLHIGSSFQTKNKHSLKLFIGCVKFLFCCIMNCVALSALMF